MALALRLLAVLGSHVLPCALYANANDMQVFVVDDCVCGRHSAHVIRRQMKCV